MTINCRLSVYFKQVYTTKYKYYELCPSWTYKQLMNYLRPLVLIDFQLVNFKLIETGQSNAGNNPESGEEVNIGEYTLGQIWGNNLSNVAFYISPVNEPLEVGFRVDNNSNIIMLYENYNHGYSISNNRNGNN